MNFSAPSVTLNLSMHNLERVAGGLGWTPLHLSSWARGGQSPHAGNVHRLGVGTVDVYTAGKGQCEGQKAKTLLEDSLRLEHESQT